MPQGMLGNLSLAATRGPRNDLEDKLAGPEGEAWLVALKLFLRKENPWTEAKPIEPAPIPAPEPPVLLDEVYTVPVGSYAHPTMSALEADFGKGNVSPIFDGAAKRKWEREPCCMKVNETPGNREMRLLELKTNMKTDPILAVIPKGWRVALTADGVAYARKYPEVQRTRFIIILGESALGDDGHRDVPVLGSDGRDRFLNCGWRGNAWRAGDCVLLVREDDM